MRTSSRAEGGGEVELKMVAGVGFEPHDLDLMRVASYQAALSRNLNRLVAMTGLEPVTLAL